jgi:hypothetical protein
MFREPVQSENLAELGYDVPTRRMQVVFVHGPKWVYTYENVPAEIYVRVRNAESIGVTFNELVRRYPALYPYTKERIK